MARASSKAGVKAAFPGFIPPALATLQREPPVGTAWLHEFKLDGYRLQAHILPASCGIPTSLGEEFFPSGPAHCLDHSPVSQQKSLRHRSRKTDTCRGREV